MKYRQQLFLAVVLLSLSTTTFADDEGFQSLFDGRTFTGWEGNLEYFRIEDEAMVGGTLKKPIPHNEFLCTKKQFADFELRLEAKLVGKGNNAGIQFRSRRKPNHHEVIGYQCDMGTAFEIKNIWGYLYDESRRNKFIAEGDSEKIDKVFKPNQWNQFVIRCEGTRIRIWLNGLKTVDYTEKDDQIASRGIIGLQIHGGDPAEASYRNITIKVL